MKSEKITDYTTTIKYFSSFYYETSYPSEQFPNELPQAAHNLPNGWLVATRQNDSYRYT